MAHVNDDEKTVRIGKKVLRESELEFQVDYNGESFVLKYPNMYARSAIETEIARRLGGMPRSAYPPEHVLLVTAAVYANAMIVPNKHPDWFVDVWTTYDEELVTTLYSGYLQFRDKIQSRDRPG